MSPTAYTIAFVVFIAGGFLRFHLPPIWNRLLLCLSIFALVLAIVQNAELSDLSYLFYGTFVLLASYSFSWYGAGISVALIACFLPNGIPSSGYVLAGLILTGLIGTAFHIQGHKKRQSDNIWQLQLYKQLRQLSILKEISIAIQSTMEVGKLLHIILTAITAGFGLGFNRALLFLMDDSGTTLKGELGIGSMTRQDGINIWYNVVSTRMNVGDFIAHREEAHIKDYHLNDLLRAIDIPVISTRQGDTIQTIKERKPVVVREVNMADPIQALLANTFGMTSFALVPMVNQGKILGLIVVDNNINLQPLDLEEVDNIIPLAAQASIAIENSRLYERTERMSFTDGLTGLYNQRYYQQTLEKLVAIAEGEGFGVCLILMDIDHFKHYNDTNGHLEGNNVLIGLGKILSQIAGQLNVPCRFGGEEFVILLPRSSLTEAAAQAEVIRTAVEQYPFHNRESQPAGKVTVSIGVSAFRLGMSMQQLQDLADSALYAAKRSGKNRVVVSREGADLE